MKDWRKIKWELAKKLRTGKEIVIKPTMVCNLKCPYCSVNKAKNGRAPIYKKLSYLYWLELLKNKKLKSITFSGGEPSLYPNIDKLLNELVKRKHIILIFTNLVNINSFLEIKPTWRIIFLASYHEKGMTDKQRQQFADNYNYLSKRFYITIRELRHPYEDRLPIFPQSKIKIIQSGRDDAPLTVYAPDGQVFNNCDELDEAGI